MELWRVKRFKHCFLSSSVILAVAALGSYMLILLEISQIFPSRPSLWLYDFSKCLSFLNQIYTLYWFKVSVDRVEWWWMKSISLWLPGKFYKQFLVSFSDSPSDQMIPWMVMVLSLAVMGIVGAGCYDSCSNLAL